MGASHNSLGHIDQSHMDLISRIYDLPLRPERWQSVLDEFAPSMNAAGASIMAFDPIYAEHHVNIVTSNFMEYAPSVLADFNERFGADEQEGYNKMALDPKREFVSAMETLSIDDCEYNELPAVKWLNENFNICHRAASCLNLERIWTDLIAVQFPNDRGPITDHERETGSLFLGHFAKSIELGRAFGVLKSRFDGVLTALDRFHIGIFVLSPNGSVVVKNLEADRLLDSGDGISLSRDGQLHPTDDGQRAELKDAITKAVHTAQAQHNRAESLLKLSRRSGDDPYLVEVAPIRDQGEIESQFNGCLVFVIDPTKTDVVSTEGMQTLYGLTNSESEICKLVAEGFETDEVADVRNLTRETVRTYIKKILQKTGVNNRSQLVRLALNVNLPIDPVVSDD